jgi:3-hydroxyacyl-CoA dehydrogenase/3a,7a,12a-trihydroxy-5b-cholest-24-enoyl-CoA hydratase
MVREGTFDKPECRLTISERDFLAFVKGDQSVAALYQNGKLRVDGDVRVAQKLDFLKSLAQ